MPIKKFFQRVNKILRSTDFRMAGLSIAASGVLLLAFLILGSYGGQDVIFRSRVLSSANEVVEKRVLSAYHAVLSVEEESCESGLRKCELPQTAGAHWRVLTCIDGQWQITHECAEGHICRLGTCLDAQSRLRGEEDTAPYPLDQTSCRDHRESRIKAGGNSELQSEQGKDQLNFRTKKPRRSKGEPLTTASPPKLLPKALGYRGQGLPFIYPVKTGRSHILPGQVISLILGSTSALLLMINIVAGSFLLTGDQNQKRKRIAKNTLKWGLIVLSIILAAGVIVNSILLSVQY